MVTRLFYLFLLLPLFLFSGEFTSSVNRTQVNLGESITLNLTLKEATSKTPPSVDDLKKQFTINSQQQSFNTVMMNGHVTSSTSWRFILIPQKEGDVTIPAINIETTEGTLSSNPITIQVVKGKNSTNPDAPETNDVILTTEVSNANPYKNEPIIYTVRIVSKRDLADIQMQKFNVEDAIVEVNGQPKIYHKAMDGINAGVIEFEYLITPIKAGPLRIPTTLIQGVVIGRKKHSESFFDDNFDPFSMMQGFDRLKPFSLATEEIVLEVQPPIPGMSPWLPAKSLTMEEVWNENQTLQVGEPLTRGFTIFAEGIKSSQLPNLNDQQNMGNLFKVYADKPELLDEGKGTSVKSYRKEQYTLIPQQAGTLTLPELSIAWWDVTKKEKVITRIPAKTLQIQPAPASTQQIAMTSVKEETNSTTQMQVVTQRDPLLYAIIGGLAVLLITAIFWAISLQRKVNRFTEKPVKTTEKPKKAVNTKREKLPCF